MKKIGLTFFFSFLAVLVYSQTAVSNLSELRSAVQNSNQNIVMQAGNYNLEDLSSASRNIIFSGSNNTIDLTGVYIEVPVGSVDESYILIEGNNNTIIGGEVEDVYRNGMTEVTDFGAYNQDRTNLAKGLGGAAVMTISGSDILLDGFKLTTRGSFPYGYGSMYGIGGSNTFGLDKRCGILLTGQRITVDNVELQHRAFGHGIYMQNEADDIVIKNTLVEGRMRESAELYQETDLNDLPYRANYIMPHWDNLPVPMDEFHSLCEDGIRQYGNDVKTNIIVENCTVKKMRGGIRLYLGGPATVTNSTAIDCGTTNWNMPTGGIINTSSGNFAYSTLSDFRLSRNNMDIEWTIIPSPHATGPHNLCDVLGSNHNIVFHRTSGPVDADEERAIVISGDNSTIVNETEYTIILEASASGNNITTCGRVIDYGSNNTLTASTSCATELGCHNTTENIQAECYDMMSDVVIQDITGVINEKGITAIENNDWIVFEDIDLTETIAVNVTAATAVSGTSVEVRAGSVNGILLATVPIANTTGYDTYQVFSVDLSQGFEGETDVYFVFTGGAGALLNVDKMGFEYSPCYLASYQAATITNAKDFCEASAVIITTNTNAAEVVSDINDGDYLRFSNFNFGVAYNTVRVSAASGASGGTIEVRSGGVDGTLLAAIEVENTSDWNTYNIFEGYLVSDFTGVHDIYLVFRGGSGALLNLENFQFYQDNCVELVVTNAPVNAEDFCEQEGAVIKDANEGGQYISAAIHGDYYGYGIFDFNANQLNEFQVTFAKSSVKDTFIELRLDSPTGALVATLDVTDYAGGSQVWTTRSTTSIQPVTGVHKLYIVIRGQQNTSLVNYNWFQLVSQSLSIDDVSAFSDTILSPNPASGSITISNAKNATLEIYNLSGSLLLREELPIGDALINLEGMASGMYLFKLNNKDAVTIRKIVKQ